MSLKNYFANKNMRKILKMSDYILKKYYLSN